MATVDGEFHNIAQEEVFSAILDVSKYPDFFSWCSGLWVIRDGVDNRKRETGTIKARVRINTPLITDEYISHINYIRPNEIELTSTDSTHFRELYTRWRLAPLASQEKNGTHVQLNLRLAPIGLIAAIIPHHAVHTLADQILKELALHVRAKTENT